MRAETAPRWSFKRGKRRLGKETPSWKCPAVLELLGNRFSAGNHHACARQDQDCADDG